VDSWSDTAVPRYLLNGFRRGTAATTYFSGKPTCRLPSSGPVVGKPFTTVGYHVDQFTYGLVACLVPSCLRRHGRTARAGGEIVTESIETPLARSVVPEISMNS
jgi:hypothetical protein